MGPIEENNMMEQRCCSQCKCPYTLGDFKQIIELKSSGLLIYVHKDTKSAEQKKRKDVFILHNPSDKELKRPDYIKEMCQYKTKCIQCREFIRRVRSLLDEITDIKQNEVIGVCEYCKRLNASGNCKRCEYFAKKFKCCQTDQRQAKNDRFLAWLSKVDALIQNILECRNVCTDKLYSEPSKYLNELLKLLQELKPSIDVARPDCNLLTETMKSVYDSKVTEMLEELLLKMRFYSDLGILPSMIKLPNEPASSLNLRHHRLMSTLAKSKEKLEAVLRKMKYDIDSKILTKMQKYAGYTEGKKDFERSVSVDSLARNKEILEELLLKIKYDRMMELSVNSMVDKDLTPKDLLSNLKIKMKKKLDEKEFERSKPDVLKTRRGKSPSKRRDSLDADSHDPGNAKDRSNKLMKRKNNRHDSDVDDAKHCKSRHQRHDSFDKDSLDSGDAKDHKNKLKKRKKNNMHDSHVDDAKHCKDAQKDIIGKKSDKHARNIEFLDADDGKNQKNKIKQIDNIRDTGVNNAKDHKINIRKKEKNHRQDMHSNDVKDHKDMLNDKICKRRDNDASNINTLGDDMKNDQKNKIKKRDNRRESGVDNAKDHKINIRKKMKNKRNDSDADDLKKFKDLPNDRKGKGHDEAASIKDTTKEKNNSQLNRIPFDKTKDRDSFIYLVKQQPSHVIRGNKLVSLKHIEQEEIEAKTPSYKSHINKSHICKPKMYKEHLFEDLDQADLPAPFGGLVVTAADDGLDTKKKRRGSKSAPRLRSFAETEEPRGILYKLSDGEYIKNGWTIMPQKKTLRKVYMYKMEPALPQYDWFENNKDKKVLFYDSGEKLADIDDDGHGRWYYKNGEIALDFHNTEEGIHGGQRYVVYSRVDDLDMGKTSPRTVLASFDYYGNGVVYDRYGTERLKYNQFEGILHDESVGPTSRWKWHSLNEPPELHEVIVENYVEHIDPGFEDIFKNVSDDENPRKPLRSILEPNNSDMQAIQAIEREHHARHMANKIAQKFEPFKIRTKALKMNDNFSLRVLDQANIYVLFREGSIKLKLNVGMNLINELVDADTVDPNDVVTPYERLPALSQSLGNIQKSVKDAKNTAKMRAAKADHLLMPPRLSRSAYKVGIGLKEIGHCAVRPQTAYPAFQIGRRE